MWCVRRAATRSSSPRASAMCVASPRQVATADATPWSAWWRAFTPSAQMLRMAAQPSQHSHCQTCPHAPCHCPGEACSFIGSTAALLDHIAGVHGWPCTKTKAGERDTIRLRDGFNFLLAVGDAGDDGSQGTTTNHQWLFQLNVARQRLDRIISVLCFYPRVNAEDARLMEFSLTYSNYSQVFIDRHGGCLLSNHYHSSSFRVACSNLSNGLPNPDECFRFVVPNYSCGHILDFWVCH
jgi:E3 ubiquitin-protein ligase SIAH1